MVLMASPVYDAYKHVSSTTCPVIYLSPQGNVLTQAKAQELSTKKEIILLCGHYEGVDERIIEEIVTEEISIGDYVLTGGEPAALVLMDAISRLVPGVLGKPESHQDESFSGFNGNTPLLEYPHYTRPAEFMGRKVPDVLLSGHHGQIEAWRREQAVERTKAKRPDLLGYTNQKAGTKMELWDVYDCNGNLTGKVKPRMSTFEKGEYHLVCSLWIVNPDGKVLIQKRSLTKKINPGMWNITGGAASAGESSEEACLREVAEEIGLKLYPQDITFLCRTFNDDDCIFDDYITITNFDIFDINEAVLQPEEVSEIKWVTLDEIKALYSDGQFMFSDIKQLDKVSDYIRNN